MSTGAVPEVLSTEDQEFFAREGYVMLPGFLDEAFNERLKGDVDRLMNDREEQRASHIVSYRELGLLTSHPPLIEMLKQLMGPLFAMHHIHAVRQDTGNGGVHWHQDYEQLPQTNRSHVMVHVFYYLDGLNGEVGDLLVLPRSQDTIVGNGSLKLLGTEDLPSSLTVDDVPPGTAVIVHSAVWHARRAKPGDGPRYFIDVSYCQEGVLWPGYGGHQAEINQTALDNGCGRDGQYDFLYDTSKFFVQSEVREKFNEQNKGSIALQMEGLRR